VGGVGGVKPPMFSILPESWSKVSHAARELSTEFFASFFSVPIVDQLVKTPPPVPTESVSVHHWIQDTVRIMNKAQK